MADLKGNLDKDIDELMVKVIEWRHDIHENPELGNREFRTSKKIEDHLRSLGIKVETKIAYTGVVGILEGDLPGPTMAFKWPYGCVACRRKNWASICFES